MGTWCFATPEDRAWWGGMWADRITGSDLGRQLVAPGMAAQEDLERISRAWLAWAAEPAAWPSILHGGILCRA